MQCIYSPYCKPYDNQVFNHNFVFPNTSGDFPAGWDKYIDNPRSIISWQKNYRNNCVMISNPIFHYQARIRQLESFYIPVCEKQVWEAGAYLRVYRKIRASIYVNFVKNSCQVLTTKLDFHLLPGRHYYSRLLTLPEDVAYAYIEVGTDDIGQLWIENVVFKQLYPHPQSINVNTVEAVKRIIDPVKTQRICRDTVEDVIAGPIIQTSKSQDVLELSTYTFCVINEGDTAACVQLEMSPDGINFMDEAMDCNNLAPGQMRALDFNRFLRYVRVAYWTEDGNINRLRIFFQGQG